MRCLRLSVALMAFAATVAVAQNQGPIDELSIFVSSALGRQVEVTPQNVNALTAEVKLKYEGNEDFDEATFDKVMSSSAVYMSAPRSLRKRQAEGNSGAGYLKCAACQCGDGFVEKFEAATNPVLAAVTEPVAAAVPAPAAAAPDALVGATAAETAPATAAEPVEKQAPATADAVEKEATAATDPVEKTAAATDPVEKTAANADPVEKTAANTDPVEKTAANADPVEKTATNADPVEKTTETKTEKSADKKDDDDEDDDDKDDDDKDDDDKDDNALSTLQRMVITFGPKAAAATAAEPAGVVPTTESIRRLRRRFLFGAAALGGGLLASFAPQIGSAASAFGTKLGKCGSECSLTQARALQKQGKEAYCAIPTIDLLQ